MEVLGNEVLKQIAEILLDTVQCPICLIALRPPVAMCSNGHGLCPDCKPNTEECPTCREKFIDTSPTILHQLLDALPRDCQFKTLGCTEVYVPGSNHEEICGYRSIDCKVLECEWSGQARKLKDHAISTHDDLTTVVEFGITSNIRWPGFDPANESFRYIPFVADDLVFWAYVYMSLQVNKLCISFTQVPIGVPSSENFFKLSFKNGNIEFTHTIQVPLDTGIPFGDFLEDHCMMIPQKMVPRFINEDADLAFSFLIVKE